MLVLGFFCAPEFILSGDPNAYMSDSGFSKSLTPDFPSEVTPFSPWAYGSDVKIHKLKCRLSYRDKFSIFYRGIAPATLSAERHGDAPITPNALDAFYIEGQNYKLFIGQGSIRYQSNGRKTVSLQSNSDYMINKMIVKFEACGYEQ